MKLSLVASGLAFLSACTTAVLGTPTPSRTSHYLKRQTPAGFVASEGKNFVLNGAPFKFAGANAYWMFLLNEDSDVVEQFAEYQAAGVKVVRIWGFREAVGSAPAVGNFTQLWQNGVATCSPDGLARFKVILDAADAAGIKVIMALTNNWSVTFPDDPTKPPGYYSNSYGGIDTYVQQIKGGGDHDAFYTDETIQAAYQKYLTCLVPTFKDHAAVFSWELANDPRCQGAVGTTTSSSCNTATITKWVNTNSAFVKTLDPNHMVNSGDGGFQCTQSSCPKINRVNPPAPATSLAPGEKKRKRRWLTSADVLKRARESEKAARGAIDDAVKKMRIRGGWAAPATLNTKRSLNARAGSVGSAYDGSHGVDSSDICDSHTIDYCSIQIFPDQNSYAVNSVSTGRKRAASDSSGTTPETIADAVNFVLNQASDSSKPTAVLAAGVTNTDESNNLNNFDSNNIGTSSGQNVASSTQQQQAVSSIGSTASSVNAMLPWQQGSTKHSAKAGSIVNSSTKKRWDTPTGLTPNDGYAFYPGDPIFNIWVGIFKKFFN
ncbi:hypothetical protein FRB96_009280 [Tulasnella sp. 330]|nr:hypothetical protein FRB96_009280 [Tulasnella sp. 330]KAG8880872.1 hypothetical protein FRB97_000382 [Tulasnella sp. 331]KAG8887110.1 hypothetical protein FRB98_000580 [Tulasnella sp. 332]